MKPEWENETSIREPTLSGRIKCINSGAGINAIKQKGSRKNTK